MKRTRIIALVSTLCICLALFATGVWAVAVTVNFNLNGNLKYYPEGVYVELSGQVYRGSSETNLKPLTSVDDSTNYTLEPITNFDNSTGKPSGNFPIASWDIGSLPFAPQQRYIKIEVNVTNYSEFEILGTPDITGTVTTNSNITTTDTGSISLKASETKTYELLFKLNDGALAISDASISVSFDFIQWVLDYSFFKFETADGQPSNSQEGTVIAGFDTANYTEETAPETLIIPAYNESGDLLTIKGSTPYVDATFINLISPAVVFQEGLTQIGSYAFSNCNVLTNVTLPKSFTSIGSGAFKGCINLKAIKIPKNIKTIETSVFNGCKSLDSMVIPDGVTTINASAFADCISLIAVEIPSTVEVIAQQAFKGCTNLKTVIFKNPDNWVYASGSSPSIVGTEIPSSELSNPEIAATKLVDLSSYFWKKKQ